MIVEDSFGDHSNFSEDLAKFRSYKSNHGSTSIAYAVLALLFAYQFLYHVEYSLLFMFDLAWRALLYMIPFRLISLLDPAATKEPQGRIGRDMMLQGHRMKSEAIKRILGLDPGGIMSKVQQTRSFAGITNLLPGKHSSGQTRGPPGLGNWDNSCYQNSIIQGLASLQSLPAFLNNGIPSEGPQSTKAALTSLISKLNDPSNAGQILWTPVGLKSMSSWQQQDAQEYFSKVLDEVDKEILKISTNMPSHTGLGDVADLELDSPGLHDESKTDRSDAHKKLSTKTTQGINPLRHELTRILARNPLEGLLAQRVGCLQCGYVEGLSLIPFNCLTVPLGKQWIYDVRTCLDDYTTLEPISGVECVKCTLLKSKDQLERLLIERHGSDELDSSTLLTEALQTSIKERLSAVTRALDDDDFSDSTLLTKCQLPARNRVSTTKSRQAVIARAPQSLVIHVNRSVFDDLTGLQRKNLADVHFPKRLDLTPWCLGNEITSIGEELYAEGWTVDPSKSLLSRDMDDEIPPEKDCIFSNFQQAYDLRAIVTHYGRHENGHYICYRKYRSPSEEMTYSADKNAESWWRLSDEDVSMVSEDDVLAQGGVFMLFYEKIEFPAPNEDRDIASSEPTALTSFTEMDSSLINGIIEKEPARETCTSQANLADPIEMTIYPKPQPILEHEIQDNPEKEVPPSSIQEAQLQSEPETQFQLEQEAQLNSEKGLKIKQLEEDQCISRFPDLTLLPKVTTSNNDSLSPTYSSQQHTNSSALPLTPSTTSQEEMSPVVEISDMEQLTVASYSSKPYSELSPEDLNLVERFQSGSSIADNSSNPSVTTSITTSASHTPITDASPPVSPSTSPTDTLYCNSKEDLKENQKLTSPLMRTSGPLNGRGSVGRANKAMGNVSSMVTAN